MIAGRVKTVFEERKFRGISHKGAGARPLFTFCNWLVFTVTFAAFGDDNAVFSPLVHFKPVSSAVPPLVRSFRFAIHRIAFSGSLNFFEPSLALISSRIYRPFWRPSITPSIRAKRRPASAFPATLYRRLPATPGACLRWRLSGWQQERCSRFCCSAG